MSKRLSDQDIKELKLSIEKSLGKPLASLCVDEQSSFDYKGCSFLFDDKSIKWARAKKTPKKQGYFVAIWKRNHLGEAVPFGHLDDFDYLIIDIMDGGQRGFFIFPKKSLVEKKIVSSRGVRGKNGIRVYPSWECSLNKSAELTKKWQGRHFFEYDENGPKEKELIKKALRGDFYEL